MESEGKARATQRQTSSQNGDDAAPTDGTATMPPGTQQQRRQWIRKVQNILSSRTPDIAERTKRYLIGIHLGFWVCM